MNCFTPGWFVIYTRPRHEKKVETQLTEMNITSFLPCTKELRVWSDRKKYVEVPLFPSYIFVRLETLESYYTTLHVAGVIYFLRSGKQISRVEDAVIENIRLLLSMGKDFEVTEHHFAPGQQLYIQQGVLTGQRCEFIEWNGARTAIVRVDLLQRSLLVTLPKENLLVMPPVNQY